MILVKELHASYGKNKVINGLTLHLDSDQIHGIVGLNGSGKTTLLNCMYGFKKSNSGEIKFNEGKLNKKQMSFLQTENFFYRNITGEEYLSLFKNDDFDTTEWNKLFHLPLNKIIDTYSTGMKKKLAFLGILKMNKPIMILDEPFNGLDIEAGRILRSVLLRLKNNGKTIIVTSHIIETLTNLCDHIHYLENGGIKYSRKKDEFEAFEKELFESIETQNEQQLNKLMR